MSNQNCAGVCLGRDNYRPGASSCLIKLLRQKGLINFFDSENGADFKNPFLTCQAGAKGVKNDGFHSNVEV